MKCLIFFFPKQKIHGENNIFGAHDTILGHFVSHFLACAFTANKMATLKK